ncbi:bifunctional metallophosphatase/5'-nucleotidase [Planococcus salinarum]|uniref:bifunctional metallophosphatase/5'-nucleotidase n=1 Tax=Planococcus salinarum TaxID=622695 RepID=UPI000E3CC38C|nr:bifunctional UDP-sugar hydrolase/5'-nucleotidase [Planococcus salinarum]TAA71903.1 bifunctional metallophosphatase/5'-nucleotidase [Planococcus salinarum]
MAETIHIYHTNDLHSHFANWPSVHAFLAERKRWHQEMGDFCLILDIGDHVDRSHPFTEGTAGKGNVQMLNDASYDAVTIGNNEGITLSKKELDELYTDADFDVILSNLLSENGQRPEWAKPYKIFITAEGKRIGLVGATAEFTPFYERLGWKVTAARDSILQSVEEIKEQTDFIVCLSHLGIREDEILAESCPEIDLILGAHTHHIFHEGKIIGNVLLGAAGKFGAYLGHVIIEDDLIKKKAYLIETEMLENPDEGYDRDLRIQGKTLLREAVFHNEEAMKAEWFKESQMAQLFGKAMIEFSGADCALFNAGLFMEDMPSGEITRYDFHQMLPHPINPCMIELTGAELKEIYLQSMNSDWPQLELKGLGFRGTVFGKMIRTGMDMENHKLFISGKLAESDEVYKLITLDMFTFGYFFPEFKRSPKTYFMPEFIRDVFSGYFSRNTVK